MEKLNKNNTNKNESMDSSSAAMVSGCGTSEKAETRVKQVELSGLFSSSVTDTSRRKKQNKNNRRNNKNKNVTEVRMRQPLLTTSDTQKSSEVPLSSSPSTSKAAAALTGQSLVKNPASGRGGKAEAKPSLPPPSLPSLCKVSARTTSTKPTPPPAKPGTSKNPRQKGIPRKAANLRRSALHVISSLGCKNPESLTAKQRESLAWAQAHLSEGHTATPSIPSLAKSKRQRSEEEATVSQQPLAKKPKPAATMKTYSEMAKTHLLRAIIDRSSSEGAISHQRWILLEKKLLEVFLDIIDDHPGPSPQYKDAGWFKGRVKLTACADERSVTLFEQAIRLVGNIWEGADLAVVPMDQIPRRPRSILTVPDEPSDPKVILRLLQKSNSQLPTHDWKILSVGESVNSRRKVVVLLNKESLEPLRKAQGSICYGFNSVSLRFYKGDSKNDLDPADIEEDGSPALAASTNEALVDIDDARSVTDMVGNLSVLTADDEDEDALLDSDQEEVNITIVEKTGHGEGNTD